MLKEGQKDDSTYRAQRKLIFHSLAEKITAFECK